MARATRGSGRAAGFGALLALLALAVNVLCPPGFMVSPRGRAPAIVICTGHGPAALPESAGLAGHRPGKQGHDAPCAFTGHALAAPPPVAAGVAADFARAGMAPSAHADLTPGRGLAAPPPPSHAPPILT